MLFELLNSYELRQRMLFTEKLLSVISPYGSLHIAEYKLFFYFSQSCIIVNGDGERKRFEWQREIFYEDLFG